MSGIADNTEIARIASSELGPITLKMLEKSGENDDVVFFLGRLAWLGKMKECVPYLLDVACKSERGTYARIAALRVVMEHGTDDNRDTIWRKLSGEKPLSRKISAELLHDTKANMESLEYFPALLTNVNPKKDFDYTGLSNAFHDFIDRLPIMANGQPQPLGRLVDLLSDFLKREPYVERRECHVSEEFAWLMPLALHAVDRLVEAKSETALEPNSLFILSNMPSLRYWHNRDVSDHKSSLNENVPRWEALNDKLYWHSISQARAHLQTKHTRLTSDWQISFMQPFWGFSNGDFDRCLAWISNRKLLDDRLVALNRCFGLYRENDQPSKWLERIKQECSPDPKLKAVLAELLNPPPPSVSMQQMEEKHKEYERADAEKRATQQKHRNEWVAALRAEPRRILENDELEPGQLSNDQYWLMQDADNNSIVFDRSKTADWKALEGEFGSEVARAYRDAAIAHWRNYEPGLRSEGANTSSVPYALIFAMAGLEIEAAENPEFPNHLTKEEARHAFRYLSWELNGFPKWLEKLFNAHEDIGFSIVEREVLWELENLSNKDHPSSTLHDIVYHAPWLHRKISHVIIDWLSANDLVHAEGLRHCISIMKNGEIDADALGNLASLKLSQDTDVETAARWFSLWVDAQPSSGLPALRKFLTEAPMDRTKKIALHFAVDLIGGRRSNGQQIGNFRTVEYLNALYALMHEYIVVEEDIDRANKGTYSPGLRDDAQDARSAIFSILKDIPGEDTYNAFKELERNHPDITARPWMAYRARERAILDGEEPAWTEEQFVQFSRSNADH